MRVVRRGGSPISSDFNHYGDAKTDLIARISKGHFNDRHLGSYCSYCEREIPTNLAVEHIIPKGGEYGDPNLECTWTNFLLACVNCNSTKKDKEVVLSNLFLPDRDNTFVAFEYLADGSVIPSENLSKRNKKLANNTLMLVGLDKKLRKTYDANGNEIAQDRASQRIEVWGTAQDSLHDYTSNINNEAVKNGIIRTMLATGFFSVWMAVFKEHPEMKSNFINAISGTRDSGCFSHEGANISPHPNEDGLNFGGKI
ncbi:MULTISPECIES: HNH endonuclease [Vibrio]|uniref:HNH endonuclease n=1 Tax=Vibrio TaxID=662 RepID=UPI0002DBDDA2|nr:MULTISPECIES: HNH endonuclease [Vibrio]OCH54105.1 hypothetical protein A6E08_04965 [Vibrio lentus]